MVNLVNVFFTLRRTEDEYRDAVFTALDSLNIPVYIFLYSSDSLTDNNVNGIKQSLI